MNLSQAVSKTGDLLKIAGIIVGLAAPCVTFYAVTNVRLAQQEIRISQLERRADKLDEVILAKLDQQSEKISAMAASIARLEARR